MDLPTRLRYARRKRGLKQRQLSNLAGLKPTYVGQLEFNGILEPGYDKLSKIAAALDVPLEWLAEEKGDEPDWGPEADQHEAPDDAEPEDASDEPNDENTQTRAKPGPSRAGAAE